MKTLILFILLICQGCAGSFYSPVVLHKETGGDELWEKLDLVENLAQKCWLVNGLIVERKKFKNVTFVMANRIIYEPSFVGRSLPFAHARIDDLGSGKYDFSIAVYDNGTGEYLPLGNAAVSWLNGNKTCKSTNVVAKTLETN